MKARLINASRAFCARMKQRRIPVRSFLCCLFYAEANSSTPHAPPMLRAIRNGMQVCSHSRRWQRCISPRQIRQMLTESGQGRSTPLTFYVSMQCPFCGSVSSRLFARKLPPMPPAGVCFPTHGTSSSHSTVVIQSSNMYLTQIDRLPSAPHQVYIKVLDGRGTDDV